MPSQRECIEAYFAAISALDSERCVSLFAKDGQSHDPYGGRPWTGHANLKKFFAGVAMTWASLEMKPETVYYGGNRAAAKWTATGQSKSGKTVQFEGINVFEFDDQGYIERLCAYWDAGGLMAQLK